MRSIQSISFIFRVILASWFLCTSASYSELVTLTVESAPFPTPSSASVFVDAGLFGDDTVTSSISGTLTVDLLPSAVNPATAQVTALSLQVDDEANFEVGGGFFFPRVSIAADAGSIRMTLIEPGEVGEISQGQFSQFENLVGLEGMVTASVEPDPIDLSEQEPTSIDFEDVSFVSNRQSIELGASLITEVDVPIDAGLISLSAFVAVEAELKSTGQIPPADYVWEVAGFGETSSYTSPAIWRRGDVANTGSIPTSIDKITLSGTGAQQGYSVIVDLDGEHSARQLEIENASAEFMNGTLTLAGVDTENSLSIEDNWVWFRDDANLESSDPIIVASRDFGTLTINGQASEIIMNDGTINGSGTIEKLTISKEATLGTSPNVSTLRITNELDLDGEFYITSQDVIGEFTLVEAGSIDVSGLSKVTIGETEVTDSGDGLYMLHQGEGLFGVAEFGDTSIEYRAYQATIGDADGDGLVQFADFLTLSANFGNEGTWQEGDFNGDGTVGFPDFLILSENFASASPQISANVPAPSGNLLWLLGTFALCSIRQRRRQ